MDFATLALGAVFTVGFTLALVAVAVLRLRHHSGQLQQRIMQEVAFTANKASQEITDRVRQLQQELEHADATIAATRTERMRAVSTFKTLKGDRSSSMSGEQDELTKSLMPIAENPFVQGWANRYGIDPVRFLQGDPSEVDKVHRLLPADNNSTSAPAAPAPPQPVQPEQPQRRVI